MNNEIQQFYFNGAALRTLTDKTGEPWFVAKDVCDILEISNVTMALQKLDDDERSKFNLGRQGETNIVNEAGLYVLVLGSRKPEAHEFKRWVTHEVLPQIRRTGGYIHTTDTDSDEDILAKAVLVAQKTIEHKNRQIAEKDAQIKALEPKALFADAVAASDGTCLVGELAKMLRQNGLNIGQNRLFRLLRQVRFEPQRADAEGDGPRPVPHQGDRCNPLGRPRDHQPHAKGHRQGTALFHRPLLPEEEAE